MEVKIGASKTADVNKIADEDKKASEKKKVIKKNHWTAEKVDKANKKINTEIYERSRQEPIQIKLDDLAILINDKITRRGIAKGLVSIQENLNNSILKVEKKTMEALLSSNKENQYSCLIEAKSIMKIEIWSDIRFLMINNAITPGEITELIRRQLEIDKDVDKWLNSIKNAISANR